MGKWIVCSHPKPHSQLRLLCFPHAGGSARIFHDWPELLPSTVEVCAVELPGRGKRLFETPYTSIDSLIPVLGPALVPFLDIPFACFGHSLGARIAFEVCRWLQQTVQLTPLHLWTAAARAPHLPPDRPPIHGLSNANFIVELRQYNGTPESVLKNPEMMELMLPMLKADFSLLETYQYRSDTSLTCPVTCFWGEQDEIAKQVDVAAWRKHTSKFTLEAVPGDHFFINHPMFPQRLLSQLIKLIPTAEN
mgnify:CR=1 FL=1